MSIVWSPYLNPMPSFERARDERSFAWLDTLAQDLRYAFRGLRRSPGFTAAAVLTLGLGIGANAAMFGVIDRLMFHTPPYLRDPASVKRVYLQSTYKQLNTSFTMPYTRYLDFRNWTNAFSDFAAVSPTVAVVGVGEQATEEPIAAVSASFFGFFSARPVLGRFFGASEDQTPTGVRVAVISYGYWQSRYGGHDVLGQSVKVSDYDCTIIGVAPQGFAGVSDGAAPAIYIPVTTFGANAGPWAASNYWTNYNWDWVQVIVRVKPGVSTTVADADLTNAFIRSRLAARIIHPNFAQVEKYDPHGLLGSLNAAAGPAPGLEARTLLWVSGVAAIVLLIACANVANLSLARAIRRRREVALRLALGVSKTRLIAQSLSESLLLSFIGCAFGVAIAQWGGALLARLFIPDAGPVSIVGDWRAIVVAVGAALFAGLATGLAPVAFAERDDLAKTLKSGVREGTYVRSSARSAMLVLQGALSVVLLVGAALFVRSLANVRDMRLGYDAGPVLQAVWDRRGVQVSDSARQVVRDRVMLAALAIPGVEHAAWVNSVPFEGTSTQTLMVEGVDSVAKLGRFDSQTATPDYFATMQTRILRGRGFTAADVAGAPKVMVISEGMSKIIWPGQDAIGKCVRVVIWSPTAPAALPPCATVVGIAEDAVHNPIADEPYRYYLPLEQFPEFGESALLLRMRGNPARSAEAVRRTLQKEMTGLSFVTVRPLADLLQAQRRSWRIGATMFVGFGILALLVASVGLYGVIAYTVAQRMHELGVRVALGARPGNIVGLVVGQGLRFSVAGVAVGTALALAASRWMQPLLFRQSATDPIVYGAVAAVLMLVAIAASSAPALRAAKADPNVALRSD